MDRGDGATVEGADGAEAAAAARRAREEAFERRRARAREVMAREFRIDSALIDMPKLARIMGMSAATLYGHVRAGKFFMPCRVVNGRPLVTFDDLVDWYCGGASMEPAGGPPMPNWRPVGHRPRGEGRAARAAALKTTQEIADEAHARLGIAPLARRKAAPPP